MKLGRGALKTLMQMENGGMKALSMRGDRLTAGPIRGLPSRASNTLPDSATGLMDAARERGSAAKIHRFAPQNN